MNSHFFRDSVCVLVSLLVFSLPLRATDVLGYHNDQQSTGLNDKESVLTPAYVKTFVKRWKVPVDGNVYAQPLYKAGVQITSPGHNKPHDTIFVATEGDSLYAIDAKSGELLWVRSLLTNGLPDFTIITTVPYEDVSLHPDLRPQIGITGTPVIDPTGGFLYVAAKSKQVKTLENKSPDNNHPWYVYTLFKIAIGSGTIVGSHIIGATGYDKTVAPVDPNDPNAYNPKAYTFRPNNDPAAIQDPFVSGTGVGSILVAGQDRVYFNAMRQMNRPGLVLYHGNVYIAFGSHTDWPGYHGWLLSFDAGTLELTAVFNTTPNGSEGGIWQGGGIPALDDAGNFYFMTGNGSFDSVGNENNHESQKGLNGLNDSGFPIHGDYGDCFVKIALDPLSTRELPNINGWGLKVVDYFAPGDNQTLNDQDLDLGSGGVMVIPNSAAGSEHPHLAVGAGKVGDGGKAGNIYLIDRDKDKMGKFIPNKDVAKSLAQALVWPGSFSTPAWFNGNFYWAGCSDHLKKFSIINAFSSGTNTNAVSISNDSFGNRQGSPTITASGTTNGLVWVAAYAGFKLPGQLRVYDAKNLTNEVWESPMSADSPDKLGEVVKFSTPTVADGMAFVGTADAVYAYGAPVSPQSSPSSLLRSH